MTLASTAALGACEQEFEPPDPSVRVERAAAAYSLALFDTIVWEDPETRITQGNVAYAEQCRRCHGTVGSGETDYARARNLTVPSLVEPDWAFANLDSLRRRIYTGHESGMPVFGDGTLDPRQIDATAAYILLGLRPEVLGGA
ncbi:MAG TPA: cytochrome c [Longimicrobiales bacterium]|nr:cytochrome c [Longimicrobiales bacterium]